MPEGAGIFCKLMVLGGLIGTLGEGIPALVNATGNIRTYQIVFHTFNLLGLPIAWLFFRLGYNQYVILIIYCIIYFLSAIIRLILLKQIYHFTVADIINISYFRIFLISIPLIISYFLYNPSSFSFTGHIIGLIGSELFLLFIILLLGFDSREKKLVRAFINQKKHK